MTKFRLDPNDPPRLATRERARLASFSEEEIERFAVSDPDAAPPTDEMLEAAVIARRVRHTRERLGLTQAEFAEAFHIPADILRDWEQGRRRMDAPAEAYLMVIQRDPDAVRRALNAT